MGAGKSTVAAALGGLLHCKPVDTDTLVEEKAGQKVSAIFAGQGEAVFRSLEAQVIAQICQFRGLVVALGGGAVVPQENWQRLQGSGKTIYLDWPSEILFQRIKEDSNRPLVATLEKADRAAQLSKLLAERRPLYERCDLTVRCQPGASPRQLAFDIFEWIEKGKA